MNKTRSWLPVLVALTWIVYASIILFFDPVWSGTWNVIKAVIGLGGGLTAIWFVVRPRLLVGLGFTALLFIVYVVDWAVRVVDYMSADPDAGLFGAIGMVLSTPLFVFLKLAGEGFLRRGLIELYWTTGMPLLQACLGAVLTYYIFTKNMLPGDLHKA